MKNKGKYLISWVEEDGWCGHMRFKSKKKAKIFARSLIHEAQTDRYTMPIDGEVLISKVKKEMKS